MVRKLLVSAAITGALVATPASRAEADAGDFIGGAIVGGLVTGAIIHNNQQNQKARARSTTTTKRVYRPAIPVTQQGRETQVALNYFGFNAGRVDGQVGSGTRRAIERYQISMGYPVNGHSFDSFQFNTLMEAYYWGINGGQAQTRLTGQPLLHAYRDRHQQTFAYAPQQPAPSTATTVIVAPGATAAVPVTAAPTPTVTARAQTQPLSANTAGAGTETAGSEAANSSVPNLFAGGGRTASLANRCNSVMLQTSTNGGYTTLATLSDPGFTLQEQFCVARSYAISNGEQQMQAITGLTEVQIVDQCGQLAGSLGTQIDAVSLMAQGEAERTMREFALSTGVPPSDLAATSRVCLAIGYRQDDMRMAVGSALMLSALGDPAYGELLGHHLLEGFGTSTRRDLAMQWYNASLTALENGAKPAFMPGQPERTGLLRAATTRMTQGASLEQPIPASGPSSETQALPTFQISQ